MNRSKLEQLMGDCMKVVYREAEDMGCGSSASNRLAHAVKAEFRAFFAAEEEDETV